MTQNDDDAVCRISVACSRFAAQVHDFTDQEVTNVLHEHCTPDHIASLRVSGNALVAESGGTGRWGHRHTGEQHSGSLRRSDPPPPRCGARFVPKGRREDSDGGPFNAHTEDPAIRHPVLSRHGNGMRRALASPERSSCRNGNDGARQTIEPPTIRWRQRGCAACLNLSVRPLHMP